MVLEARVFSAAPGSERPLGHKHLNHTTMKVQLWNAARVTLYVTYFAAAVMLGSCKEKEGSTQAAGATEVKAPEIDIHTAVISGNVEAVEQHIKAGTDINTPDPFGGSSPLISAAVFGKPEVAAVLANAGADLNFQNKDGSTALHTAAFFCRPEIVKMLLSKGADKSIKNKFGVTPYEMVAGPFADMKNAYDMMGKVLGPMGLTLDYGYIEKTRPEIAEMLK
jgi:hypothetical protein